MTQGKKELTAQSLEMNRRYKAANLYKKRMQLLMQSGLIKGIIPLSMRKKSNQIMLDTVLKEQDGKSAEKQKLTS